MPTYTLVSGISNVGQVIWVNEYRVVFVKDENIYSYDVEDDILEHIEERNTNEFVGVSNDGSVLKCGIENYVIRTRDEFSTKYTIDGKELWFFETIRPIYMDDDVIVSVTGLDFLQQHMYVTHILKGDLIEVEDIPKRISNPYVFNRRRYFVEDVFGNLYLVKIPIARYLYQEIYIGAQDESKYEYCCEYVQDFLVFNLYKIFREYDIDWNQYREYIPSLKR